MKRQRWILAMLAGSLGFGAGLGFGFEYEAFDYEPGTRLQALPPWSDGKTFIVKEGAVSFPVYAKPKGNFLYVAAGNGNAKAVLDGAPTWTSCFLRIRATNRLEAKEQRLLAVGGAGEASGIVWTRKHPTHPTAFQLGISAGDGAIIWSGRTLIPGSIYLLVTQFDPGKQAGLWINPRPGTWERATPPEADLAATGVPVAPLQSLTLFQLAATTLELDEFRLGKSWKAISHKPRSAAEQAAKNKAMEAAKSTGKKNPPDKVPKATPAAVIAAPGILPAPRGPPAAPRTWTLAAQSTRCNLTADADAFLGPGQFSAAGTYAYLRMRNRSGSDQDLLSIVRFDLDSLEQEVAVLAKGGEVRLSAATVPVEPVPIHCYIVSTNHPLHRLDEASSGRRVEFQVEEAILIGTNAVSRESPSVVFNNPLIRHAFVTSPSITFVFVVQGEHPHILEFHAREAGHPGVPRLSFECAELVSRRLPRQALKTEPVRAWRLGNETAGFEARLMGIFKDHVMLMSESLDNRNLPMMKLSDPDLLYLLRLAR